MKLIMKNIAEIVKFSKQRGLLEKFFWDSDWLSYKEKKQIKLVHKSTRWWDTNSCMG